MPIPQKISNMNDIWTKLEREFNSSHEEWNDETRVQFDMNFWKPLHETMPGYFKSLGDLDRLVQQAKQSVK